MTTPDVRLGSWEAVRLVAGREVTTKMRSKAFIITTVATLVLLVGFALVMKFVGGGSDATVGVTQETSALAEPLKATASQIGQNIEVKTVDEKAGRAQVADGSMDALVVGGRADGSCELSSRRTSTTTCATRSTCSPGNSRSTRRSRTWVATRHRCSRRSRTPLWTSNRWRSRTRTSRRSWCSASSPAS